MGLRFLLTTFCLIFTFPLFLDAKTLTRDGVFPRSSIWICFYVPLSIAKFGFFLFFPFWPVKALNEIKASLGWRVVYAWVGDDPCGDGDLPPWSGVTCSTQGDYRVVTEL